MFGLRLLLSAGLASACISNFAKEDPATVPKSNAPNSKKTTPPPKGPCTDLYDTDVGIQRLSSRLENKIFGQPLAVKTVLNSIKAHHTNSEPRKALLLSFHGSTGTGKSHLAQLIATSLFRGGMDSPSLNLILGSAFEDGDQEQQKIALANRVRKAVTKCPRAVFIIDDADQLAEGVLDVLLPFVEYHESVNGIDYRKSSFILISSGGGREVNDVAIKNFDDGVPRETLHLRDFERKVTNAIFNQNGGLKKSQLISKGVIDAFVPFLPLDKTHVKLCVVDHLKHSGRHLDDRLLNEVADSLQYFRGDLSSSGCKKVASRTETKLLEEMHADEL